MDNTVKARSKIQRGQVSSENYLPAVAFLEVFGGLTEINALNLDFNREALFLWIRLVLAALSSFEKTSLMLFAVGFLRKATTACL